MAATTNRTINLQDRYWECKDCHEMVSENNTVAYHLMDKILYGWCQTCFSNRGEIRKLTQELAA